VGKPPGGGAQSAKHFGELARQGSLQMFLLAATAAPRWCAQILAESAGRAKPRAGFCFRRRERAARNRCAVVDVCIATDTLYSRPILERICDVRPPGRARLATVFTTRCPAG
jgi:hypothetical protein